MIRRHILFRRLVLVLVGCVGLINGCSGRSDLSTVEVSITVDGKPVSSETATFTRLNGGEAVSANIVDGKYRADGVSRGRNLVIVNDFVPTGGTFLNLVSRIQWKEFDSPETTKRESKSTSISRSCLTTLSSSRSSDFVSV
jgi:hypothetical protein